MAKKYYDQAIFLFHNKSGVCVNGFRVPFSVRILIRYLCGDEKG
jgi:hypothetical protein